MTRRRLRDVHAEATRTAILASARETFTTWGYGGVSLDEIADHAGVTKGAVYHHFRGKPALFEAVYTELAQQFEASVRGAVESLDDPWARVEAALELVVESAGLADVRAILFSSWPEPVAAACRAVDEQHFLALVAELLTGAGARQVEVGARLLLAALIEAAAILGEASEALERDAVRRNLQCIARALTE